MPLLRGESGSARVRSKGPLDAQRAIDLFDPSCRALQRAHLQGQAHGSVEPDSFFFTSGSEGGPFSISLIDYGVARFVDTGDKLWRAPEQCTDDHQGPRVDVWALGLLGFFMLTGRTFWEASGARDPTRGAAVIPPAGDAAASLGLPLPHAQAFDTWFSKCVAVDPEERFENAAAVLKGLRKVLAGVPLDSSAKRVHSIPGAQSQAVTLGEPERALVAGPAVAPLQATAEHPWSGGRTQADSQAAPTQIPATQIPLTQIPVTEAAVTPVVVVAPRRSFGSDLRSPSNDGAVNAPGSSGLSALAQGAIGGCAIGAVGIAVVGGLLLVLVLVLVFAVSGNAPSRMQHESRRADFQRYSSSPRSLAITERSSSVDMSP